MSRFGPKHKRTGLPTVGFVSAHVRRYYDQRAEFILILSDRWEGLLKDLPFDLNRPVIVNAIFQGVWKKSENWPRFDYGHGTKEFFFRFRDVLFKQDDKVAMILSQTRYQNKRSEWEFTIEEMGGSKFAKMIRDSIPKLGQGGMQCESPGSPGGDRSAEYE